MRDVSRKITTRREAKAQALVTMSTETLERIRTHQIPKGDPLEVAKVAAIQAAKNTSSIIPYCHPLPIDFVGVDFALEDTQVRITVVVKANYKTGVEMEALTAASVAALTLYDMLKMLDEDMAIEAVTLLEKSGGKGDFKQGLASRLQAGVLVMSDSISAGKKSDIAGQMIVERLKEEGIPVSHYQILPDEVSGIRETLLNMTDTLKLDLIITTGGTGISPRDNTPEAMSALFEREIPGIAEAMRAYGQERTPYAMFSRSMAGVRGQSIIINLPGSAGGVQESLDALFPSVLHSFKMLWGYGHPETDQRQVPKPLEV